VSQTDTDQQLRIWKDLAISKQVLMNEAALALKLKDDFTAEDLRSALDVALKRANDADANMADTRNRASEEIGAMQAEVKKTLKSKTEAEAQRDAAIGVADTPDNIIKKLKTLKKQKVDEANARKTAEDANRKLKKESKQQKEELENLGSLKEQAASLLAAYRELRTWADEMEAKNADGEAAPKVDAKLLSDIETTTAGADEAEETREAATA